MGSKSGRNDKTYVPFFDYIQESGLLEDLRKICVQHRVTIKDVYLDKRGPTIHAARLVVWWWMTHVLGKSALEVGRVFDRDNTTILHALARLEGQATSLGVALNESTIGRVAKELSSAPVRHWQTVRAQKAAKRNNNKATAVTPTGADTGLEENK